MKRLMLRLVTIIIVATMAACGPKTDPNIEFVKNLKTLVGPINSSNFQQIAFDRTYGPANADWMKNTSISKFTNNRGEEVTLSIGESGEPRYGLNKELPSIKWVEPIAQVWETNCELSEKNNVIVVYASSGTIARLKVNEKEIQTFLCEYFFNSIATINVLHINFHATKVPVQLKDVGDLGLTMQPLQFDWNNTLGYTNNIRPETGGAVVRTEVLINLNNIARDSDQVGLSYKQELIDVFVNEKVGWLANQLSSLTKNHANEAYSTLVSHLTMFDSDTADLFLGKSYIIFKVLSDEIEIQKTIATR